jgi:DNA-binding response OmpR family regulator
MKILLINNNPVVSRLTALSARKEDIEIDEIQEVTELNSDKYDIVFVDADSWSKDVQDVISENITVKKRVLFYAQDDNEDKNAFDIGILKPFLPSEVSAVIRTVEESQEVEEPIEVKEEATHFNVLANAENEKREDLFELNDKVEKVAELEPMELEVAENKRDLMDELEKIDSDEVVSQDTFDQKLEEAFPLKGSALEDDLFEKSVEDVKIESSDFVSKAEGDLLELDLDDDKFALDDELFTEDVKENTQSEKQSSDEVLDFDSEKSEEVDFTAETLKEESVSEDKVVTTSVDETKILDKEEVANIKGILQGDKEDTMELEDLMVPTIPAMALSEEKELDVEKKKKSKKEKASKEKDKPEISSDMAVQTLASLPIESLRELLAGARININIKFPKAK